MLGRLADRRKGAEPLRKTFRQRRSIQIWWLRGRGKKQTGLQKREPCGHDQVIRGKLETQLSRGLDEEQILLGQRQDGDARQIHPLPSSEFQQQIKRTFETVEIHRKRRLASGLITVEIDTKCVRFQRITSAAACWRTGKSQARGPALVSTGHLDSVD